MTGRQKKSGQSATFPEGKTRDIAAEGAGFGSVGTSRRVGVVLDASGPQLTAMMDRGRISPARGMAGPMLARREMRKQKGLAGWEDGKAQFIGS